MNIYREKYKDIQGKTNSMYLYILYECTQEKILEHIKRQIEIINRINDHFKRHLYLSRYYIFREFIETNSYEHIYNSVLFINDDINEHLLSNENKDLLKRFNHSDISFSNDNHFDLNYLEDLIFNDHAYHLFRIINNKIDYLHLTKTKKVIVQSKETKSLNIMEFINSFLPANTKYIIYGVSSKLKTIDDDRAYTIINKLIKDSELIDIIERIDQEDILSELYSDLEMLNNSKCNRLIFKKDLITKIRDSAIQKIYIDSKLIDKFNENMMKLGLNINFRIIKIDQSTKSFIENREKILDQYDGVLGITYY